MIFRYTMILAIRELKIDLLRTAGKVQSLRTNTARFHEADIDEVFVH